MALSDSINSLMRKEAEKLRPGLMTLHPSRNYRTDDPEWSYRVAESADGTEPDKTVHDEVPTNRFELLPED